MKKKDIQLRKVLLLSRYNEKRFLEEKEPGVFILVGDMDYMRIIYNDDGTIYAIDPTGGPFISVGSLVSNKNLYIKCIDFNKETGDYLIYTEN